MKLIWRSRPATTTSSIRGTHASSHSPSVAGSNINLTEKPRIYGLATPEPGATEKEKDPTPTPAPRKRTWWGWKLSERNAPPPKSDQEKGRSGPQPRPIRLFAPAYNGFGAALSLCE